MSNTTKKGIIVILILMIIGLLFYNYSNSKKQLVKEEEWKNEKLELMEKLSNLEIQYDDAIAKNTKLSEELITQKENIKNFKDSLRKIKTANWKVIKFYKAEIKNMNAISSKLVRMNDSLVARNNALNLENQDLYEQKESLKTNLDKQNSYNNTLLKQNLDLAKKVAVGEVVKASNFSVLTYKEKRNGRFKESDKTRNVAIFKTSFILNENPIAPEKEITAFIVIKNPKGQLLVNKGSFKAANGENIAYSETTTIPYKKSTIASDVLIRFGDVKLLKGDYTIDYYIDGIKVGTVKKTLD